MVYICDKQYYLTVVRTVNHSVMYTVHLYTTGNGILNHPISAVCSTCLLSMKYANSDFKHSHSMGDQKIPGIGKVRLDGTVAP